ncbi:hypothetical protein G5V59_26825 [Nocardioides sp. W3-2-3]|uniref:hypothetical protein n=1 Tax=Nocardioides convexus TaxID=2712224 RepID=UPI0024189E9F|nr:hypothetical protein [Nocardioides convexus]NHA02007.1 hypothetical protein [Nocardioides convexus]
MPEQFKPGDRVYVVDTGLAALREVMRNATGQEPAPNHHGTVEEVQDSGSVLIYFDDGVGAPYPAADVRHLDKAADRSSGLRAAATVATGDVEAAAVEAEVTVERVDKYTIVVDGARISASEEQELRIRALSVDEQRRLASIFGGVDG